MNKFGFMASMAFLVMSLIIAAPVSACPDKINCVKPVGMDRDHLVGTIDWPTCYKAFSGCRPRHCDNARDLPDSYWTNQCAERFAGKCVNKQGENKCRATFPTF